MRQYQSLNSQSPTAWFGGVGFLWYNTGMKRIFLFLVTNIAVMITLGIVANLLCTFLLGTSIEQVVGPEWTVYLIYAFVYGMLGAFISLLFSKPIAKMSCRARTIDGSEGEAERWLVATVTDLAQRANIKTPEVAIYPGAPNAFATGAFKNSALVAVSTEIMGQMSKEELRAVLGHEMSHVANGDMVTMTLTQGVLNAFVIFASRVIAGLFAGNGRGSRRGAGYVAIASVLQVVLGIPASMIVMAYSRRREFAADAGSADLLGSPSPMIAALRRLVNLSSEPLPDSLKAFGINGKKTSLFATHPSLEDRIEALMRYGNNIK